MKSKNQKHLPKKSIKQYEFDSLLTRCRESEAIINAIQEGDIDALIVNGKILNLKGADFNRQIIEEVKRKLFHEKTARIQAEQQKKAYQRLSAELKRKTLELSNSNKELEQFAYVASHDLQEPLRKIMTFADRLKLREQNWGETEKDYLKRIELSAARMKRLIEDLLHFSMVTAKPTLFEKVDLEHVAKETASDLEVRLAETNGEIYIDPLPTLHANKFQIRQLFQNLLMNSLKFRKADEPPKVHIQGSRLADGKAQIKIIDNGIGFDVKYLGKIFKPFQRLHAKNEFDGSGIGLAICQKIAQHHHGFITAQSELGKGSTFIVTLSENGALHPSK
jgi:two-component system, LuxR family, sensor kinase FixL